MASGLPAPFSPRTPFTDHDPCIYKYKLNLDNINKKITFKIMELNLLRIYMKNKKKPLIYLFVKGLLIILSPSKNVKLESK